MSDYDPDDIDFGEEDPSPSFLGRVKLTLDGTVFAKVFSYVKDAFTGTGAKLFLADLKKVLNVDERDDIDRFIDENLEEYQQQMLTKNHRVYYSRHQLKEKLDGMRSIWHYVVAIYHEVTIEIDDEGDEVLSDYDNIYIVELSS